MEKWRDVIGYVGYYQVSDRGRVRSVDRVVRHPRGGPTKLKGRILRPRPSGKYGHVKVVLCKGGFQRSAYIHRLVLAAWVGPCPEGCECLHGLGGVSDNSVSNLQWGNHSENELDKRRDGTDKSVPVIRSDGAEFISIAAAAKESGCDQSSICACCKGRIKTTGGFGWKYKV